MIRLVGTVLLGALVLALAPSAAFAQARNCDSFPTQAAAQAAYRADPNGLRNLDADNDGIACESNPGARDETPVRAGAPAPGGTPGGTTLPSTGAGVAGDPSAGTIIALAAFGVFAAGGLLARRRR